MVKFFPMSSNGASTGLAPIQVRMMNTLMKDQNFSFERGLNLLVFFLIRGRVMNTMMDASKATTPPSFDGIDRRMA